MAHLAHVKIRCLKLLFLADPGSIWYLYGPRYPRNPPLELTFKYFDGKAKQPFIRGVEK